MIIGNRREDFGTTGNVERTRLPDLLRGARREVLSTLTGATPGLDTGLAEAVRSLAYRPDLRVRLLCAPPDDRTRDRVKELIRSGVQVKVAGDRLHESLLIDRKLAVVGAANTRSADVLVVLTAPSAVSAMVESFAPRWAAAMPWALVSGEPGDFERSILRCLVAGMTDDVVADRLGVSARTVRRYVNVLMDLVGARSRFELGFRAAESSWLEPDTGTHLRVRFQPDDRLVPVDA
ncbi:DNA-binding NarL/FixJ family response regulator [Saccharothrix tamanrassetensis]|uniref:DNA-binding NarL/FixJ family response regulator n=1 Tax=Saccharothrix tamanrassetensis TaxID=1051531 RepID=A0A841CCH4_9PSEU|nr:LuxR C-terminal-related transcriptional regulator [Saccharothrix tamanrassetensis]MBB5953715.1 DNA-binding NarL/FixJ family response regulator [Saccharothrix tamanrassetensis]